jgi:benzoylformate decarboxylase
MLKEFPDDFDYYLALHEAVAVAMADAYSQATGNVVHVNLHTAAGSGNAMGNIQTAWFNRTPMIITAGQQTREMLLLEPLLANKNPYLQASPWVKWSYEPARAEDVPAAFLRAYAAAVQAPAGPVYLSLPMDDMDKQCPLPPAHRKVDPRLSASLDQMQPVVDALDKAKHPALVIGAALDQLPDGWNAGIKLAEKLACPVWAPPFEARPGFPETHALYQGVLPAAIKPLSEKFSGNDLILVIGAPVFKYYPHVPGDYLPKGVSLIQITDSAEEASRAPVGDSYIADPARACKVIEQAIAARKPVAPQAVSTAEAPKQPDDMITADYLFYVINELKPKDFVITQESFSNMAKLKKRIPIGKPRSYFAGASGVLGYGLPAAIGVALAERESERKRKVICLLGDGATQYVVQSFWNAAQERLNILFVLLRNREYAILKSNSKQLKAKNLPSMDLPGIDTVKIAQGYGCEGGYVRDPRQLKEVLTKALSHEGPYILQVEIDPEVPKLL